MTVTRAGAGSGGGGGGGGSLSFTPNSQTGTTYTLIGSDAGKVIEMNNTATNTVAVPANADVQFAIGTIIEITMLGSGRTKIAAASGVTISPSLIVMERYKTVQLRKRGSDEWIATGDTGINWTSDQRFGSWYDPMQQSGIVVNNNVWNDAEHGPQTIYANSWRNWQVITEQPGTGADDGVKAYPDTQLGVNLPVSSMTTLPSSFDVTTPAGGGVVTGNGPQWNAAYDLWFNGFGKELMIWNNWTANWQYYNTLYSGVSITVDGVLYQAWNNGTVGTWFIRQSVTNVGTVDIAHIIAAAVSRGWLVSGDVLNNLEYGFEIMYTGTPMAFTLNDFDPGT